MLLCNLNDIRPGATLGAVVRDPRNPSNDLLKPGVALDEALIRGLEKRGVTDVWIEDDLTADLNAAVAPRLAATKLEVYSRLRDGLASCARGTLSSASMQSYRAAVLEMVTEAISSAKYAAMTDALFGADGQASHGTNVAYLSLLCGLQLEPYVIAEQPRLSVSDAREMSVLGLAGMMHDIGKVRLHPSASEHHEVSAHETTAHADAPKGYADHVLRGKSVLERCRVPARVSHAVLNHHQRFDGEGWPDMSVVTDGRMHGPLAGRRIHIFARIVAAANVLDNLLRDADGRRLPPVAALATFASERFDGWFDPIVRRAMIERVPPFGIGTTVTLNNGRRAVVEAPSIEQPCHPRVRLLTDGADGEDCPSIDLSEHDALSITHALGTDVTEWLYDLPAPQDEAAAA